MSNELLFEIGTEEIPAGFLSKAVVDMEDIIRKTLTEKRIAFEQIRCLATPRRLVLSIADVAPKQDDQTVEKLGPAKKLPLMKRPADQGRAGIRQRPGRGRFATGNHCHR